MLHGVLCLLLFVVATALLLLAEKFGNAVLALTRTCTEGKPAGDNFLLRGNFDFGGKPRVSYLLLLIRSMVVARDKEDPRFGCRPQPFKKRKRRPETNSQKKNRVYAVG